jgi:class 3 adenylate cyclase
VQETASPKVTAHILFVDVVGYSTLTNDEQTMVFRQLQEFVSACPAAMAASANDQLVRAPQGDGMALAFFDSCSSPLQCACELSDRLEKERAFKLRMGIHSGEVTRLFDINGTASVSGDGINTAQRVMDFGDGGHILMSLEHASCLQAVHDPAADACYDIGIATAKHSRRIHLFNFHRPAVGAADVPVKVRADDGWVRPKTLRLGTSGRNIVLASLQILGWLFISPFKWRTHVTQIDPRLTPNFTVLDLTGAQVRRNRDLRQLLVQVYLICPGLLTLLILGALTPFASRLGIYVGWWIGSMWAFGLVTSILLGVGAGLITFVILTFDAVIQAPAIGLFGYTSAANQIALAAICVWATVAWSAVFPTRRQYPAWREILGAIATFLITVMIYITVVALMAGRHPLGMAAIRAVAGFILINVVIGLRWKRWSRGFVFGQFLGLIAGAGTLAGFAANGTGFWAVLQKGLDTALGDAVLWAAAFSIGEKMAGSRAAIMGCLMLTAFKNMVPTLWSFLPILALWTTYTILRRRSLERARRDAALGAAA